MSRNSHSSQMLFQQPICTMVVLIHLLQYKTRHIATNTTASAMQFYSTSISTSSHATLQHIYLKAPLPRIGLANMSVGDPEQMTLTPSWLLLVDKRPEDPLFPKPLSSECMPSVLLPQLTNNVPKRKFLCPYELQFQAMMDSQFMNRLDCHRIAFDGLW